jgi:pimeloyl-ACP methyl ester carboxylesterase
MEETGEPGNPRRRRLIHEVSAMQRRQPWVLAATAAICWAALGGRADGQQLFVFKDGFSIEGRVKEAKTYIVDPATGASFSVPANKPHWIDDGVRNIYFSPFQLQDAIPDMPKKADQLKFNLGTPGQRFDMPYQWEIDSPVGWNEGWNDKWERTVTLSVAGKKRVEVKQRITALTPELLRIDAYERKWTVYFKTSECDPQMLRALVMSHVGKDPEKKDIDKRAAAYKFLLQAGFVEAAEKELEGMLESFPAQKSNIEPLLSDIKRMQAVQLVEAMERSQKAGMWADVQRKLALYAKRNLDSILGETSQLKVLDIKNKQEAIALKMKEAKRLLADFALRAPFGKTEFYKKAAAAITAELDVDTVGRLETFVSQAQDYERAVKDKRKPDQTVDDVLAFALTGWMRGSDAAERNAEVASLQWEVRQALVEYQETDNAAGRMKLLQWLKGRGLSVDEVMQMIRLLPPPDALKPIPEKAIELQAKGNGAVYHVQLPPGYQHGRAWPVLMVLHHSQEKPAKALERWASLAAQHGYILVAPQWGKGLKVIYQYTAEEHDAVLATLRDLRRRFQIDSDRVFLFGGEQGGQAAFDIALSHPDQFAGVVPMAAAPNWRIKKYSPNAQHLQLYAINGSLAGKDAIDNMQALFRDWNKYNYPAIYVEYKGRQAEWFGGEQTIIFDWMSRKKRVFPLRQLGVSGEEFTSLRPTDNQFYWLSTDTLSPGNVAKNIPARLTAQIFNDNSVHVKSSGVGRVTIWFAPKMLNYAEKVTIKLNGAATVRQVTPNLDTLLENFYQTGDRQRMFFARLDLKV